MGNCYCTSSNTTAMVVDTSGNVHRIKLPLNSGELMIEQIGHVITPADVLQRTRRISPLGADEELLPGKLYLLVPASRVHSKASPSEIAKTHIKNHKSLKMAAEHGEDKITPVGVGVGLGYQGKRRWNPVLDPIMESSRESNYS
ncbi:uncharacterized protein [Arachis hypogaea]|uniref:uncharacterized protein n=1 Tax=Arachis hypogaea TaxID=3818 RepID=UPI0034E789E9|nr:uncharacterized protein DS421_6g175900 [Arachis hypogaea]